MPPSLTIATIPFPLTPTAGSSWRLTDEKVEVTAAPHSDIFVDPSGESGVAAGTQFNAVSLLGDLPEGDFTFEAEVGVGFRDTFDAGTLLLWFDEFHWAKLCFERSPQGETMVVSVVTRGVADDANSFPVAAPTVRLRMSRTGRVYAFHASTDAVTWKFVRAFAIDAGDVPPRLGLEAQSPVGDGCEVSFRGIAFHQRTLADLRDGS